MDKDDGISEERKEETATEKREVKIEKEKEQPQENGIHPHLQLNGEEVLKEKLPLRIYTDEERLQSVVKIQTWYRRMKWKRNILRTFAMNKRRNHTVKEILSTEMSYVAGLQELMKNFREPLFKQKILSQEEVNDIFSNIDTISEFQNVFLAELQLRLKNWTPFSPISDIFVKLSPYMKMYFVFVKDYKKSMDTVERLYRKKKKFAAFIDVIPL
eukprot:TRINITY_DN2863_c0_g1_i5.p1 TRINITY_DN2863_c0_g1~~TRINITY_DN2863_c0_g1_i5.p1  ORF type:complete len:214 (+),score=48.54 TRINITY_DN2863_c0_g1_i5:145-786(+)